MFSVYTMAKAITKKVVKKVTAKKEKVAPVEVPKFTCTNCEDSGRECNTCFAGKDVA